MNRIASSMPIGTRTESDSGASVTIGRCRELLGDDGRGLSDSEVDRIRRHADAMAHLLVELFMNAKPTNA